MANHYTRQIPDLSEAQEQELQRWVRRAKTAQALVLRARIVLQTAAGKSDMEVAGQLGTTRATVGKWRRRFLRDGCDGLLDEPRPGAPRTIGDDDVERVVVQTYADRLPPTAAAAASRQPRPGDRPVPAAPVRLYWASIHGTEQTQHRVRVRGFHLHFTPTSASWINQVERWFAAITERQIRRGTHRSTEELEQAIDEYLTVHNENPKPFIWTKSADQILESLKTYCEGISDTGH